MKIDVMEWINSFCFHDEPVRSKKQDRIKLPTRLRAARSLANEASEEFLSRDVIFVQQAKLLADYEDSFEFRCEAEYYYSPTYQSLNDQELRGYFTWRTLFRKGQTQETPAVFSLIYIFELLNLIGVNGPQDGYQKLCSFRDIARSHDQSALSELDRWLSDFVIYYGLPSALLPQSPDADSDNAIEILLNPGSRTDSELAYAARVLSPRWLGRSGFYSKHRADMDTVIAAVLRRIYAHYDSHHAKPMVEQLIGSYSFHPVRLFDTAVFQDKRKDTREYAVNSVRLYKCSNGRWTVGCYGGSYRPRLSLDDVLKTIDAKMRLSYGLRPIIAPLDVKWLDKIISGEVDMFSRQREEAEERKRRLDPGALNRIRQDAAVTREALLVDEEREEEETPQPAPTAADDSAHDSPLSAPEYRLIQCLLYGYDLGWVQAECLLMSVLVDGANEKLYDIFQDTVLTSEDSVKVIDDYIDELKEMVSP